jgi:hypothetical protein
MRPVCLGATVVGLSRHDRNKAPCPPRGHEPLATRFISQSNSNLSLPSQQTKHAYIPICHSCHSYHSFAVRPYTHSCVPVHKMHDMALLANYRSDEVSRGGRRAAGRRCGVPSVDVFFSKPINRKSQGKSPWQSPRETARKTSSKVQLKQRLCVGRASFVGQNDMRRRYWAGTRTPAASRQPPTANSQQPTGNSQQPASSAGRPSPARQQARYPPHPPPSGGGVEGPNRGAPSGVQRAVRRAHAIPVTVSAYPSPCPLPECSVGEYSDPEGQEGCRGENKETKTRGE